MANFGGSVCSSCGFSPPVLAMTQFLRGICIGSFGFKKKPTPLPTFVARGPCFFRIRLKIVQMWILLLIKFFCISKVLGESQESGCYKIILFHLPKAGGTSFLRYFQDRLSKDFIIRAYNRHDKSGWSSFVSKEIANPKQRPYIIFEHHKLKYSLVNTYSVLLKLSKKYAEVGCKFDVVVLMREPLQLITSAFCYRDHSYQMSWPSEPSMKNLQKYLYPNLQSYWYTNSGWFHYRIPKKYILNKPMKLPGRKLMLRILSEPFVLVLSPEIQKYYLAQAYYQVKKAYSNCTNVHLNSRTDNNLISSAHDGCNEIKTRGGSKERMGAVIGRRDLDLWQRFGSDSRYSRQKIQTFKKFCH